MVRPHNINISKSKLPNSIKAMIKSSIYMGDRVALKIDFNKKEIIVETAPDLIFKEGENVYLSFRKIAILKG